MFDNQMRKMAGEQLTTVDLLEKGFMVLQPLTDIVENYDLVIETTQGFKKVQVKTGQIKDGRILIDVRRSSKASGSRHYEDGAYDLLAVVCIEQRRVAYILKEEMSAKASISVWMCKRDEIPVKGIHKSYTPFVFDEHLEVPIR